MKAESINILIACEESQAECMAFREKGFNAFSCDIQECKKKGHPEYHINADVTPYLKGETSFTTQIGKEKRVSEWHMIIAHPPCTYMCKVSSVHMVKKGEVQKERFEKMLEAREFFFLQNNGETMYYKIYELGGALAAQASPSPWPARRLAGHGSARLCAPQKAVEHLLSAGASLQESTSFLHLSEKRSNIFCRLTRRRGQPTAILKPHHHPPSNAGRLEKRSNIVCRLAHRCKKAHLSCIYLKSGRTSLVG